MNRTKQLIGVVLTGVSLLVTLLLLTHFNLVSKQIDIEGAQITINFLFPMEQDALKNHIKLKSDLYDGAGYTLDIEWVNEHTCKINLKEQGEIKGNQITLAVENAPTIYKGLEKTVSVPIQFKAPVQIVNPTDTMLITTEKPFYITFNTPIEEKTIHQYIQSDAPFYIEPALRIDTNGKTYKDFTRFKCTPKERLENSRNYVMRFKEGMPSKSGEFLEEAVEITLTTAKAPEIKKIVPADESKWIGLYPRILLESNEPITKASIQLGNLKLDGDIKNEYFAQFYLPERLDPDTSYQLTAQIEALSGEMSEKKTISFQTIPILENQIWVEIVLGTYHEMIVYEGTKELKRLVCSGGTNGTPTAKGTYYLNTKGASYYNEVTKESANYSMILTEGLMIHGMLRDENWQFVEKYMAGIGDGQTRGNILLNEEDAKWLYELLPDHAMVIIR